MWPERLEASAARVDGAPALAGTASGAYPNKHQTVKHEVPMPHPQSHRLRALIDDVCAATRGMTVCEFRLRKATPNAMVARRADAEVVVNLMLDAFASASRRIHP